MGKVLRSVGAVVAGLVVGFIVVGGLEAVNYFLYPPPAGLDMMDPKNHAAVEKYVASLPVAALVVVVAAQSLGAFVAAWIAGKLANRSKFTHGMVVAVLFLLATLGDLRSFPHPVWMWLVGPALVLAAGYGGARFAAATPRPDFP